MSGLIADIRADWSLRQHRTITNMRSYRPRFVFRQVGGGDSEMIYVRGHPIRIFTMDEDDVTLYIAGGESAPCFRLDIAKAGNRAILGEVVRRNKCFAEGGTESRDIVRAAYQVARDRGVRILEFTDNSVIYCPERVILSDLSFLTTGQTWYESIIPIKCLNCPGIEDYRRRVRTNTWRVVGHGLVDINLSGVDIDASGSAMQVLTALKKDGHFCQFFSDKMADLIYRSGIKTFHEKQWIGYISSPSQTRSSRRQTSMRRHRHRTLKASTR